MLGNMKPIPRFIIIAAVIGGAVYGVSKLPFFAKLVAPVEAVQVTPSQPQAPTVEANTPLQPTPVAPAAQEPSPSTSNAGIDAVLKAGNKK